MKSILIDIFLFLLGIIVIAYAVFYSIAEPVLWFQFLFTNS